MKLIFAEQAWANCLFWQQTNSKLTRRTHELIEDTTPQARRPAASVRAPRMGRLVVCPSLRRFTAGPPARDSSEPDGSAYAKATADRSGRLSVPRCGIAADPAAAGQPPLSLVIGLLTSLPCVASL
jgi:hypothetical protein